MEDCPYELLLLISNYFHNTSINSQSSESSIVLIETLISSKKFFNIRQISKPIVKLLKGKKSITLFKNINKFDADIDYLSEHSLPQRITILDFWGKQSSKFSSIVFPKSIKKLYITAVDVTGHIFPDSLRLLNLEDFAGIPSNLPNNLKTLQLDRLNNEIICSLPKNLHKLIVEQDLQDDKDRGEGIENLENLPKSLTYLRLDGYYNIRLGNLQQHSLKKVMLGDDFNHSIDFLPNSVEYIRLGSSFNQVINVWPKCLNALHFSEFGTISSNHQFNQEINNLSDGLKVLFFDYHCKFNYPIQNLPKGLLILKLGGAFNQRLDRLPDLKILEINSENFDYPIDNLPKSLKKIVLDCTTFNQPLNNLPDLIRFEIDCPLLEHTLDNLPKTIKKLKICYYKQKINVFPPMIKKLKIVSYHFNLDNLPNSLKVLELFNCKNLIVPSNLEFLEINYILTQIPILPDSIKKLTCYQINAAAFFKQKPDICYKFFPHIIDDEVMENEPNDDEPNDDEANDDEANDDEAMNDIENDVQPMDDIDNLINDWLN